MLFVTPYFFEYEPVKIANVADSGDVRRIVSRAIGIYEKQCLIEILGDCLYKELLDSFELITGATQYTLKTSATEPIKRLVNGYEYDAPENEGNFSFSWGCGCGCGDSNCTKRYWKGFVQEDKFLNGNAFSISKRSFVADYIYYHYSLENRSVSTGTGQKVMEGENSQSVSSASKRIDRYNEFVFCVTGKINETSLYQFLQDNIADYPTWVRNCQLRFKEKY